MATPASNIAGVVFARGGSKAVPMKNLRRVNGLSLLARSLKTAFETPSIGLVLVSSDSDEILKEGEAMGAMSIPRPPELASDFSPEWLSWQHAAKWILERYPQVEILVSIPTTSPLRETADVRNCVEAIKRGYDASICVTKSRCHPGFNLVTLDRHRATQLYGSSSEPITRRQDAKSELFEICTVAYAIKIDFLLASSSIWEGKVASTLIPQERALDIDTEWDLRIAELAIADKEGNLGEP